eukprot:1631777-Pyramimonas_sp.AAC.1
MVSSVEDAMRAELRKRVDVLAKVAQMVGFVKKEEAKLRVDVHMLDPAMSITGKMLVAHTERRCNVTRARIVN